MRLSDYVIRFVAEQGIRHVFLVVGGGAMHLNDSLSRRGDIEFVCNLHEQASAIAAETYSKATNHLGVALVTTGPGGTNAVTGVAGAWLDSTPCVFISGQVKRADSMFRPDGTPLGVRQVGVQEVDIVSIVGPITKYAVTVNDPESIRYHLERALFTATTGRPGPVWIDIPLDVQAAPIDETSLRGFEPDAAPQAPAHPEIEEVIRALNRAGRPILLAGNGIRLARAEQEFRALVDLLDIPVETTWLAIDLIADNDPLFAGRAGSIAPRGANFAIQNSDFVLALGARLDRVITGFNPERFAPFAHKVMVDIDPAELDKMGTSVQTKVHADAGEFIRALLDHGAAIGPADPRARAEWKCRCMEWKLRYPVVQPAHRAPGLVSVYHFSEVLSDLLSEGDCIVSGSSGSAIELFLLALRVKRGQRVLHTTALGAMGFGIPASIAASLARDRRRIACVDGDGGFQFNIQELETVARLQLPIKFFVLNNGGYASIRASQTSFFGQPTIGCDSRTGQSLPDLRRVAQAFGLETDIISEQTDLASELKRVLDRPGPVVCDVRTIADEVRAPRLASVQRPDGSFVSSPLEDLWPFLDRGEFQANMIVPVTPA